jgi:hypothetical protein
VTQAIRTFRFSDAELKAIRSGLKTQMRRPIPGADWLACVTGDCPHDKQTECDAALAVEAAVIFGPSGTKLHVDGTDLVLTVTKVRAELLQAISEEDAMRDGGWRYANCPIHKNPQRSFAERWAETYDADVWDRNELTAVCEFTCGKKKKGVIDAEMVARHD